MADSPSVAERVMAYAEAHYEDAPIWSQIVECYEMSELEESVEGKTYEEAMDLFGSVNAVLEDRWAEAQYQRSQSVL